MPYTSLILSGRLNCLGYSASLLKVTRKTVLKNGATIAKAIFIIVCAATEHYVYSQSSLDYMRFFASPNGV